MKVNETESQQVDKINQDTDSRDKYCIYIECSDLLFSKRNRFVVIQARKQMTCNCHKKVCSV